MIDMEDNMHKFCVSQVTCMVAAFGLKTVIEAWNDHPIAVKLFFRRQEELNLIMLLEVDPK